jgi:hypothetical protein
METKYNPCYLKIIENGKFIGYQGRRYLLDQNNNFIFKDHTLERHYIPHINTLTEINNIFIKFKGNEEQNDDKINNKIIKSLSFNKVFLFTESYGDRNICHWLTEQLMVLNYLIDLLNNDCNIQVIINKNRRQSMNSIILDYLYAIPELNTKNIVEIDFNDDKNVLINANKIYVGNALPCTLTNIYDCWNKLHSRLNFSLVKVKKDIVKDYDYDYDNSESECKYSKKIYMSRRNIYKPGKNTNTRVLENCDEISDIIVQKGYQEIYTDELEDLDERNKLFSNLDEIICELGAGMHNLLYCKNGINLTVLYQKNNITWLQEYYPLFKMKKMNVRIITGETTSHNHNGNWLNTPWKLNLDDVKNAL